MQYVGKLVSSVYNSITPNINPSTLTGAIDIIVVEREVEVEEKTTLQDGTTSTTRRTTTELAATPFHVRFGKMSVLRPAERKVTLHLNDAPEPLPFAMKVGENGEAFFVMKLDHPPHGDVPEALVTSPMVEAESDTPQRNEPEPLDLGASQAATPAAVTPAESQPVSADTSSSTMHNSELMSSAIDMTQAGTSRRSPPDAAQLDIDMDGYKATEENQAAALQEGQRLANELPLSTRHGGDGRLPLTSHLNAAQLRWQTQWLDPLLPLRPQRRMSARPLRAKRAGAAPSRRSRRGADPKSGASSTEADGEDVDMYDRALSSSYSDSELLRLEGDPLTDQPPLSLRPLSLEPGARAPAENGASDNDVNVGDDDDVGTLACADADPYLFQLRLDDNTVYTFELSLCPRSAGSENSAAFDDGRISFQRFLEDDSILTSSRLCLRHNDEYHRLSSDADVFATLALYRERLRRAAQPPPEPRPTGSWRPWRRLEASTAGHARLPKVRSDSALATYGAGDSLVAGEAAAIEARADERAAIDSALAQVQLGAGDVAAPAAGDAGASTPSDAAQATPQAEAAPTPTAGDTYVKTLRLTSDQLKQLPLRKGANSITFSVTSSYSGVATCHARIFLWDCERPVVVSDIDGTITKSDALGHVFTLMGRDWTHLGVAKLYHDIAQNGYRLMYLTSRAIGQADITRDYLKNINQNNYVLPDGPVIMSPDRLMASLHREVILRKPEVFKMACLRDIARLFGFDAAHPAPDATSPFYAGFGNRITDALSYRSVHIPRSRIFTIDANGEVKMELLELAGYNTSYPNMTDLVDQMFPPVRGSKRSEKSAAFTDFNFWREEPLDVELPADEELLPILQPTSPSLRGLRSPRLSSRSSSEAPSRAGSGSSSTTLSSPPPPSSSASSARPSRLRRLLGLRRKKANEEESLPNVSFHLDEPNVDGSVSPTGTLSTSPVTSPNRQILHHDDGAPDSDTELPEDSDDDDVPKSPEERRRRIRRTQLLYGTPATWSEDRAARRETDAQPPYAHAAQDEEEPIDDDDPLLAAGDIQFEWQG